MKESPHLKANAYEAVMNFSTKYGPITPSQSIIIKMHKRIPETMLLRFNYRYQLWLSETGVPSTFLFSNWYGN